MYCRAIAMLAIIAVCGGCAHHQLRRNTIRQSGTLTDIYEQQVLDNLAMFVHDSGSLPFFAFPNGGGSDVTDEGSVGADLKWNAAAFVDGVLKFGGRRNMKEAWVLSPVTDPRRLELMRCAYQQAVGNAGIGTGVRMSCPDCERLQKRFYLGSPSSKKSIADVTNATGIVTSACLDVHPWFCWGCAKCVPKDCKCLKVGSYCGTHVWLRPGGQEELSKLTLVILDYAVNPAQTAPAQPTKNVTWYFDADGKPTIKLLAHREVHAVVPFTQLDPNVSNTAAEAGVFNESQAPAEAISTPPASPLPAPLPFPPPNNSDILQWENLRQFSTPDSR